MSDPSTAVELQSAPLPNRIHAERELEGALASLNNHVNGRLSTLFKDVKDQLLGPLSDAFESAHRAHELAIENAGLDLAEDATLVVGEALWNSLRTYRDATAEHMIEPLRARLETLDLGQSMNELWSICGKELADIEALLAADLKISASD